MKRYEGGGAIRAPGPPRAQSNLGVALAQANRLPEAIHHYEEALQLTPDDAVIHYNLAIALWQAGRASEAASHYEEALRLKPDLAGAHNNLAGVLHRPGPEAGSGRPYEQALQIDPDDAGARQQSGPTAGAAADDRVAEKLNGIQKPGSREPGRFRLPLHFATPILMMKQVRRECRLCRKLFGQIWNSGNQEPRQVLPQMDARSTQMVRHYPYPSVVKFGVFFLSS